MAIYVLGKCGYTPNQVKYEVPIYEINQILHASAAANNATLEWANPDVDKELNECFENFRNEWANKL